MRDREKERDGLEGWRRAVKTVKVYFVNSINPFYSCLSDLSKDLSVQFFGRSTANRRNIPKIYRAVVDANMLNWG